MRLLVEWYKEAADRGNRSFVLDVDDFPFDRPMEPGDPERLKLENYAARVVQQAFNYTTGFRPIVTPFVGEDATIPPIGSPYWVRSIK